jgi:nucleoside-diphosphate kinase
VRSLILNFALSFSPDMSLTIPSSQEAFALRVLQPLLYNDKVLSKSLVMTFLAEGARRAMSERTLAIIKPDAVKKNAIGDIINRYEKAGLKPVAIRLMQLSKPAAQGFYAVHKSRPFFDSLCTFMSSGPCVVLVLEGDNAIKVNREIMGATDPAKAENGTIRAAHGANIEFNAVHGSDAPDTAKFEIAYFFSEMELVG